MKEIHIKFPRDAGHAFDPNDVEYRVVVWNAQTEDYDIIVDGERLSITLSREEPSITWAALYTALVADATAKGWMN